MPIDKDQTPTSYNQGVDVQALEAKINDLQRIVINMAGANAIENVIMNGFSTLATQLQPLRELGPQRTPLPPAGNKTLGDVRAALARPNWRSSGFDIDDAKSETDYSRSIAP